MKRALDREGTLCCVYRCGFSDDLDKSLMKKRRQLENPSRVTCIELSGQRLWNCPPTTEVSVSLILSARLANGVPKGRTFLTRLHYIFGLRFYTFFDSFCEISDA